MGRGWEAAAEASFTAAWCCTTQRKLGKTAIDDAPAHRGSKAHRGREVVKQPNWLPLQSASFLSKAACRQQQIGWQNRDRSNFPNLIFNRCMALHTFLH